MRVLFAVGGMLVVVGLTWLGQGVGLIGGSFMTGQTPPRPARRAGGPYATPS